MVVSIITTCYNRATTIAGTIESVLAQDYPEIEYIIVDGASRDGSLQVINKYSSRVARIISEPDHGMYEAINKGIRAATGDIIGLLHSDDFFMSTHTVSDIVRDFRRTNADLLYGNGLYVDAGNTDKIVRNWVSGSFRRWKVKFGWLPLHPTVYVRRRVIDKYGLYNESYKIAADTDFLVRYLRKTDLRVGYMDRYILRMRMGGLSTDRHTRIRMWREDVRVYRSHGLPGVLEKLMKMSWKVPQFVSAKMKLRKGFADVN